MAEQRAGARGAAVIEVESQHWNGLLEELGLIDIYLRREYVEGACALEPGRPVLLNDSGVVLAAILRDVEGGRSDVITPYGYGGPVAAPQGRPEAFARSYERWCRERGVVTTFLRFHPLYRNAEYARGFEVQPLGPTLAWRLRGNLAAEMHRHHRRLARKAQGTGIVIDRHVGAVELEEFVGLYQETMARREASDFYRFGPDYWAALAEGLGKRILLVEARCDGELLAALLCLAARPWLHYHLGASSAEGRALGASQLAFLGAAEWAQEREYELFHLGGGVAGREDSLFEFKLRFDPGGQRPMHVGKAVHDADSYRQLGGTDDLGGFFPAYRRPAATGGAGKRAR